MEQQETFTFHDYAKELKLQFKERNEIGLHVSKTYQQIFGEHPGKVRVKKYWVNIYPVEFKVIIDNIIKDYQNNPRPWKKPKPEPTNQHNKRNKK